jgi:hypothetical protein
MADKTYVNVPDVAVKESFDNKYKSTLADRAHAALAEAINRSSKLTTKAPADKKALGFYVAGVMWLRKTDKGVEAEMNVVLADWPKKKMLASKNSKAGTDVTNPAKIDKKVDEVIAVVLERMQATVVKDLEGRGK